MTTTHSTLQRARKSGNPVIQGNQATFIWEGKTAPRLICDLNDWDGRHTPFRRLPPKFVPDTDRSAWFCSLTLPRDAYLEYAFYAPANQEKFLDPKNRRTVGNGMGSRNNFFYMPEAMPSPFATRRPSAPVGVLTTHRVETKWLREDYEREVHFYAPPVREPVPLLVVYDGQDYLNRGRLATIVDNLIAERRIRPIAMAFLPNGGRWRDVEYACSDGTILWLDQVILPLAKKKLNLLDINKRPGAYGVLGASLGGTMSLYTGLRMPEVFGKVICQSGAYMIEKRDFAAVDFVRHGHARGIKIWMDVGNLEYLLEDNRLMHALLKEKEYEVIYREFSGGHNYTAWRDDVWRGLVSMFPRSR
jgi:enterochelin esterase family protein